MSTQEASTQLDYHDLRGNTAAVERIRDYRRREVAEMCLARVPVTTIAARLRVSTRTVKKDIKVIERWWRDSAVRDRQKLVDREVILLDQLEAAWFRRALWDEGAFDRMMRIMERRARMLGLDAPVQSELTVTMSAEELDAMAIEIIDNDLARRRELNARAQAIDVQSSEVG
jgi:hypothetical protein